MFDIITDSACDLTPETAATLNIEIIPFYVSLDGEHYRINSGYAEFTLLDGSAAAAAELLYEVIWRRTTSARRSRQNGSRSGRIARRWRMSRTTGSISGTSRCSTA